MGSARLLVVNEDPFALETLAEALGRAGHQVDAAPDGATAQRLLADGAYDLVIVDGVSVLERARETAPGMRALLVADQASVDGAVEALRAGALDYLAKPFHVDELTRLVARALARKSPDDVTRESRAIHAVGGAPEEFESLIGRNPRMLRVYNLIRTVAPANSTVLITGESGTGKERVAAAIHRRSVRRTGPFVRVNCSAFGEGVLESELFGHEQGAFTGAVRSRAGVFRKADHGTLFLDEVADLPGATQVKLLRAIQEREVQPVGGDVPVPVDVRLIVASNRDLAAEVKAGRFREDLYFRLNVIPIHLPPLRERMDDIPHLARHFLAVFARQCGKPVRGFTERAMRLMERHSWPGNVRELENAIERAVVLAQGDVIDGPDLPPELRGGHTLDGAFQVNTVKLSEVEELVIRRVLSRTGWNIKRSAQLLGITRATLYSKIRKFGLVLAR